MRHLLHVLGMVAVGRRVVLGVVLGIRVVVDGRVRLGRHVVGVVLGVVLLPASLVLVHGASGRAMAAVRAWHHGRAAAMLPRQPTASRREQAINV